MVEALGSAEQVLVDDKTYNVMSVLDGGMGRVWLLKEAFNEPFDHTYSRQIAVKTFDFVKNEQSVEHELNIWISLHHPSILPLKKIGRLNYHLAAIMPLMRVGNLDALLKERGSLSEWEAARIILSMIEGLEYAWSNFGILHLDIKPSNVLIENQSTLSIKIADWGISRLAVDPQQRSGFRQFEMLKNMFGQRTACSAGTPLFMAPERFSGNWILSPTVDIYSLGLIAVLLNTGFLPFQFGQIDPVEEIATGLYFENACVLLSHRTEGFRRFCLECITPNPNSRLSNYRNMAKRLKSILRKR
jgi:eukaryotic-like serine/threonine-protein kinase